jgi:hypothetical protein
MVTSPTEIRTRTQELGTFTMFPCATIHTISEFTHMLTHNHYSSRYFYQLLTNHTHKYFSHSACPTLPRLTVFSESKMCVTLVSHTYFHIRFHLKFHHIFMITFRKF